MADEDENQKPKEEVKLDLLETVIVNPDKIVYEKEISRAFLPTKLGRIAILPQHTPLYTELVEGTINIEEKDGGSHEEKVDGGVARVKNNKLKILIGF